MAKDDNATHYDVGGIDSLDVIRAKLTEEQFEGYLLGNALKYALRLNHKGSKERDAEKMANFARWHSELLSRKPDPTAAQRDTHRLADSWP